MAQMSAEHRAWAVENVRANRFLSDSASFYVSARRLLIPGTPTGLMPGLVCGAYALEQIIKAALEYEGKGVRGHNLVHLAALLPDPADVNQTDLELFSAYFQSRYFDNEAGADILNSGDYVKLDSLYYAFYKCLKIPLPCHCRAGLASILLDKVQLQAERDALARDNAHFEYYVDLYHRSSDAQEKPV